MPNELQKTTKQEIANAIGNSGIADSILANFDKLATQGQLVFPKGYNLGNQLKLMFTSLSQNGNLANATSISIGEALSEAVIQGLEIDKKQCYFIVYDKKCTMFRSYYGDIAVVKGTGLVKDIKARVIYKGDEYDIDTNEYGEEIIVGHRTHLENRDNDIVGAYAWAENFEGKRTYCIMTWKEIQKNWSKSKTNAVQREFPQEMAKRSVIRRLVKMIFNTCPSYVDERTKQIIGSYNRTTEEEYDNSKDYSVPSKQAHEVANTIVDDDDGIIDNDAIQTAYDTDIENPDTCGTCEDTPND